MVGLPSFLLGIKYRFTAGDYKNDFFKLGLGLNVFLESTKKYFTAQDILSDNIFTSMNYSEYKLGIGVSFYF